MTAAAGQGAAPRARAARAVAGVLSGQTLEQALTSAAGDLAGRDLALCRELSAGCLRQLPTLDPILDELLSKPLRRRDRELRALALVGLYQLAHLRVPPHAAVSATVDAADLIARRRARGLLNAVLRRYQREAQTLEAGLPEAARNAHPGWLWSLLGQQWPQWRAAIAQANNRRPPMTLRVNLARGDRAAYLQDLAAAGIDAQAGTRSAAAVTLSRAVDVELLPGFATGRCSVQDESAQVAAGFLAPRPGERILDACAAPGGKAGHLLEIAADIDLTAMDVNPERLERVGANLTRLGFDAKLVVGDASDDAPAETAQAFDAILADVPCSATGVIRRHPDIKVLRRPEDLASFAAQQGAILRGLWRRLKPGGRLLYVTCSILAQENQDVIAAFLAAHGDARERPLNHAGAIACTHGLQFLPEATGGDGLYFALLDKMDAPEPAASET